MSELEAAEAAYRGAEAAYLASPSHELFMAKLEASGRLIIAQEASWTPEERAAYDKARMQAYSKLGVSPLLNAWRAYQTDRALSELS